MRNFFNLRAKNKNLNRTKSFFIPKNPKKSKITQFSFLIRKSTFGKWWSSCTATVMDCRSGDVNAVEEICWQSVDLVEDICVVREIEPSRPQIAAHRIGQWFDGEHAYPGEWQQNDEQEDVFGGKILGFVWKWKRIAWFSREGFKLRAFGLCSDWWDRDEGKLHRLMQQWSLLFRLAIQCQSVKFQRVLIC